MTVRARSGSTTVLLGLLLFALSGCALLADRAPGDTQTEKLVASYACRSAIKAGQKLAVDEMKLLADQLFAADHPYSCPHGRPTIHRLSVDEVARWFHRR